jgi:hypothetical protein
MVTNWSRAMVVLSKAMDLEYAAKLVNNMVLTIIALFNAKAALKEKKKEVIGDMRII